MPFGASVYTPLQKVQGFGHTNPAVLLRPLLDNKIAIIPNKERERERGGHTSWAHLLCPHDALFA